MLPAITPTGSIFPAVGLLPVRKDIRVLSNGQRERNLCSKVGPLA